LTSDPAAVSSTIGSRVPVGMVTSRHSAGRGLDAVFLELAVVTGARASALARAPSAVVADCVKVLPPGGPGESARLQETRVAPARNRLIVTTRMRCLPINGSF